MDSKKPINASVKKQYPNNTEDNKKASELFHGIIKASVKGNPKPKPKTKK